MKKTIFIIISVVLISMLVLAGCDILVRADGDNKTGSGNLETRQYDFSEFNQVEIGDAFEYTIVQSDTFSVSITADDNLFDDIRVTKNGQRLDIDLKPLFHFGVTTLEAAITMPRLTGLESSGATHGTISGFDSADNLDLEISGASRVNLMDITTGDIEGSISGASSVEIDISADDVALELSGASRVDGSLVANDMLMDVSGASRIQLDGSANDIEIDTSGASLIRFSDFTVDNADISLSGASTCKIHVTGRIDIDLSGASKLTYIGTPILGGINLSGGSTIENEAGD